VPAPRGRSTLAQDRATRVLHRALLFSTRRRSERMQLILRARAGSERAV
jgi:hypothetical protein